MVPLLRLVTCTAICLVRSVCASSAGDAFSTCSSNSSSSSSYASQQCTADLAAPSASAASTRSESSPTDLPISDFHVTIGIKSSVLDGVESRQTIRETWASGLPTDIRVVFLGCQPDFSRFNSSETQRLQNEIASERLQYGDLLIDELLSCHDSYQDLVNKVLAFFHWSAHHPVVNYPAATKAFVMVADDDVYIRLDRLRELLLLDSVSSTRFYGGQVWAVQHGRPIEPRRNRFNTKYYLPYDQYAMSHLPPFANGPHYILSADVARFLGEHRAMFRGVGGERSSSSSSSVGTLDDVSVALWTLAMQIHPKHFPQFSNLRDIMCRNELISYADITTTAMRQIHTNLQSKRSFCSDFSYVTWLKRARPRTNNSDITQYAAAPDPEVQRQLDSLYVSTRAVRPSEMDPVDVFLHISLQDDANPTTDTVRVQYSPFFVSFFTFCDKTATRVQTTFGILLNRNSIFCQWLLNTLVDNVDLVFQHQPMRRPTFKLLQHNIASDDESPLVAVAIASSARYAMVVIECLLAQIYPGTELFLVDESDLKDWNKYRAPDIVVFAPASATGSLDKQHQIMRSYVDEYAHTSRMVMLGYVEQTDERVIVLSPRSPVQYVQRPRRSQQLYLPAAAKAFAASELHSPVELLQLTDMSEVSSSEKPPRQFCVDQYALQECDLPHRQYFFNLLNSLDHVDAIGKCPGNRPKPITESTHPITNETAFYLDEKIALYSGYKFVIAFEDSVTTPGYVSDTIVAAFLAGAVPIYYGHSATVTQLFNSRAFIDCGAFHSLRACARHVLAVHASASLYGALRREAPIVNVTALVDAFSWHPDVVDLVSRQRADTASGSTIALLSEQLKELLDNHVA